MAVGPVRIRNPKGSKEEKEEMEYFVNHRRLPPLPGGEFYNYATYVIFGITVFSIVIIGLIFYLK